MIVRVGSRQLIGHSYPSSAALDIAGYTTRCSQVFFSVTNLPSWIVF